MNLHPCSLAIVRPALAGVVLLCQPAAAQVPDRGTLTIRAGGREVGVETFQVTRTAEGFRITARAVYLMPRPGAELVASLDRSGDSEAAFQLKRRSGPSSAEIYAVLKRSRLTIRRVERGAEQASESPGGPGLALLADSVFSTYLQMISWASETGQTVTAVFPQAVRRIDVTAQRVSARESGASVIRLSGGLEGVIELGSAGELLRVSLPALGLEATRKRD